MENKENERLEKSESPNPVIYGQFTNWQPRRMFEIREICDALNKDRPNIWELCKTNFMIPDSAKELKDLTEKQRAAYEQEVKFYFDSYFKVWKDTL